MLPYNYYLLPMLLRLAAGCWWMLLRLLLRNLNLMEKAIISKCRRAKPVPADGQTMHSLTWATPTTFTVYHALYCRIGFKCCDLFCWTSCCGMPRVHPGMRWLAREHSFRHSYHKGMLRLKNCMLLECFAKTPQILLVSCVTVLRLPVGRKLTPELTHEPM